MQLARTGEGALPRGDVTSSLAAALEAAGHEVLGIPGFAQFGMTRREWVSASLLAGFGLVFAAHCASEQEHLAGISRLRHGREQRCAHGL